MADKEEESGKKGPNMLVLILGAVILLGGGAGAAFFLMKPAADTEVAEEGASEPPRKEALYHGIHPPLLVNFLDERGKGRFLQASLEVMTRDQQVIEHIKNHGPVIRNNLILAYGDVDYASVTTREGKNAMLEEALTEINRILETETGEGGVEAVYFTNIVVQ
ncbi:MAG: flagellar basal body-associated FliL family protein [Pseudomonadota bacterium]